MKKKIYILILIYKKSKIVLSFLYNKNKLFLLKTIYKKIF